MNEDDDWFEAVAGRRVDPASRVAGIEGGLLRQAMQRMPAVAPPQTAEQQQATQDGLLQRARMLGLDSRGPAWCAGCAQRWERWRSAWQQRPWTWGGGGGLVLAGLLAAVLVLRQQPPPGVEPGDTPVLRAPADGIWLLQADDPQRRRDELADRLAAAGVVVQRFERLGRHGLEADLKLPLPAAVQQALAEQHVAPAADGSLRVEFEPSRK